MSEPRRKEAVLAAVSGAFCLVVLVVMLISHAWPIWTGETIYVRVPRPVDPRDFFRGDYVIVNYEHSSFDVLPPGSTPVWPEPAAEEESGAESEAFSADPATVGTGETTAGAGAAPAPGEGESGPSSPMAEGTDGQSVEPSGDEQSVEEPPSEEAPAGPDPMAAWRPRPPPPAPGLPAVGDWWAGTEGLAGDDMWGLYDLRGKVYCVQMEPVPGDDPRVPAIHQAVSVSDRALPGQVNLCGRLTWAEVIQREAGVERRLRFNMHYGQEALFIREGTGVPIERALREGRPVFAAIAVTDSGRGRLKNLLIDGEPVLKGP